MVTVDVSIPLPSRDPIWLCLSANMMDGSDIDVTEMVRLTLRDDEIVTPWRLTELTGLQGVKSWSYLTKTLEYNKITSSGIVNGL